MSFECGVILWYLLQADGRTAKGGRNVPHSGSGRAEEGRRTV